MSGKTSRLYSHMPYKTRAARQRRLKIRVYGVALVEVSDALDGDCERLRPEDCSTELMLVERWHSGIDPW